LMGCQSDVMCKCAETRTEICWHWYCSYHYARIKEHFKTEDAEYTWFLAWCQRARWNLCLWDPELLWKILGGLVPARTAPAGSWKCPAEEERHNGARQIHHTTSTATTE